MKRLPKCLVNRGLFPVINGPADALLNISDALPGGVKTGGRDL